MTTQKTITEKIADALHSVTELRIVTAVGKVHPDAGKGPQVDYGNAKVMASRIDLLMGDITNSIDPEFATGEFRALMGYHEQQVQKGQDIIKSNLQTLRELYEFVQSADRLDTAGSQ